MGVCADRGHLSRIRVSRAPGGWSRAVVRSALPTVRAALGRAGIARIKREGDGHTPAGRFHPVAVLYRADRVARPRTSLPVTPIQPDAGWCDDPADRQYNRAVRLPYPARHEPLWREDGIYDIVLIIDHNLARPQPGAGSAVFIHVATRSYGATAGCVALGRIDLLTLLGRIGIGTTIEIC